MATSRQNVESGLPQYLREMRVYKVLDRAGEQALARRMRHAARALERLGRLRPSRDRDRRMSIWQERHERARHEFTQGHLRLVIHVAKTFLGHGLPLQDLIQEGNLGLMRAVEKFDPDRGYKFSTYAFWWIKQSIQRALAYKSSMIRIPMQKQEWRRKVLRAQADLMLEHDRQPSPEEIARRVNLPVASVRDALALVGEPLSFEDMGGDDQPLPMDLIADPTAGSPFAQASKVEHAQRIDSTLRSLRPRHEQVMRLRFGIGRSRSHTLAEIGRRLKLSRERIRQIEAEALRVLRSPEVKARLLEMAGGS